MDAARLARYADKLAHAEKRLDQFLRWSRTAPADPRDLLASYKALQEVADALIDVAAMLVKDVGLPPKDSYTNVALLVERGVLAAEAAAALREMNGLRNRVVHEYEGLVDAIAIESGQRLAPGITRAIEEVRAWASKR